MEERILGEIEMKKEKLWTPQELADFLSVKISTIYSWVYKDFLPHISITGRVLRFDPQEINEWLKKKSHKGRRKHVPEIDLETGDFIE